MLNIYLDENFALDNLKPAGLPLSEFAVGSMIQTADVSRYMFNRLEKYNELEKEKLFVKVTEPAEAQAILLPVDYAYASRRAPHILKHYLLLSEQYGKPLIISSLGDTTEDVPGQRTIVLRTSKYRWSKKNNEIFCPPIVNDLSFGNNLRFMKQKTETPSIGFVGQALRPKRRLPFLNFMPYGIKDTFLCPLALISRTCGAKRTGFYYRKKCLEILKQQQELDTRFILRDRWGLETRHSEEILQKQQQEYVENIKSNLFTLCIRGAGNFSLRLYEVLSLGRIPLLVDTDDIRPCEDTLNYNDFCFIVHWSKIANIGKHLLDFYSSRSDVDLMQMQMKARTAFENALDFRIFSKKLFLNKLPELIADKTWTAS